MCNYNGMYGGYQSCCRHTCYPMNMQQQQQIVPQRNIMHLPQGSCRLDQRENFKYRRLPINNKQKNIKKPDDVRITQDTNPLNNNKNEQQQSNAENEVKENLCYCKIENQEESKNGNTSNSTTKKKSDTKRLIVNKDNSSNDSIHTRKCSAAAKTKKSEMNNSRKFATPSANSAPEAIMMPSSGSMENDVVPSCGLTGDKSTTQCMGYKRSVELSKKTIPPINIPVETDSKEHNVKNLSLSNASVKNKNSHRSTRQSIELNKCLTPSNKDEDNIIPTTETLDQRNLSGLIEQIADNRKSCNLSKELMRTGSLEQKNVTKPKVREKSQEDNRINLNRSLKESEIMGIKSTPSTDTDSLNYKDERRTSKDKYKTNCYRGSKQQSYENPIARKYKCSVTSQNNRYRTPNERTSCISTRTLYRAKPYPLDKSMYKCKCERKTQSTSTSNFKKFNSDKYQDKKEEEKPLVKAKSKVIKRKRYPSRRTSAKDQQVMLNSVQKSNDNIWFECNMPLRMNIPASICMQNLFGFPSTLSPVDPMSNTLVKADHKFSTPNGSGITCPKFCISLASGNTQQQQMLAPMEQTQLSPVKNQVTPVKRKGIKKNKKRKRSLDTNVISNKYHPCEISTQTSTITPTVANETDFGYSNVIFSQCKLLQNCMELITKQLTISEEKRQLDEKSNNEQKKEIQSSSINLPRSPKSSKSMRIRKTDDSMETESEFQPTDDFDDEPERETINENNDRNPQLIQSDRLKQAQKKKKDIPKRDSLKNNSRYVCIDAVDIKRDNNLQSNAMAASSIDFPDVPKNSLVSGMSKQMADEKKLFQDIKDMPETMVPHNSFASGPKKKTFATESHQNYMDQGKMCQKRIGPLSDTRQSLNESTGSRDILPQVEPSVATGDQWRLDNANHRLDNACHPNLRTIPYNNYPQHWSPGTLTCLSQNLTSFKQQDGQIKEPIDEKYCKSSLRYSFNDIKNESHISLIEQDTLYRQSQDDKCNKSFCKFYLSKKSKTNNEDELSKDTDIGRDNNSQGTTSECLQHSLQSKHRTSEVPDKSSNYKSLVKNISNDILLNSNVPENEQFQRPSENKKSQNKKANSTPSSYVQTKRNSSKILENKPNVRSSKMMDRQCVQEITLPNKIHKNALKSNQQLPAKTTNESPNTKLKPPLQTFQNQYTFLNNNIKECVPNNVKQEKCNSNYINNNCIKGGEEDTEDEDEDQPSCSNKRKSEQLENENRSNINTKYSETTQKLCMCDYENLKKQQHNIKLINQIMKDDSIKREDLTQPKLPKSSNKEQSKEVKKEKLLAIPKKKLYPGTRSQSAPPCTKRTKTCRWCKGNRRNPYLLNDTKSGLTISPLSRGKLNKNITIPKCNKKKMKEQLAIKQPDLPKDNWDSDCPCNFDCNFDCIDHSTDDMVEQYDSASEYPSRVSTYPLQKGGKDIQQSDHSDHSDKSNNMKLASLCSLDAEHIENILDNLSLDYTTDTLKLKPLVLVPFRLDKHNCVKMVAICEPEEWRELTEINLPCLQKRAETVVQSESTSSTLPKQNDSIDKSIVQSNSKLSSDNQAKTKINCSYCKENELPGTSNRSESQRIQKNDKPLAMTYPCWQKVSTSNQKVNEIISKSSQVVCPRSIIKCKPKSMTNSNEKNKKQLFRDMIKEEDTVMIMQPRRLRSDNSVKSAKLTMESMGSNQQKERKQKTTNNTIPLTSTTVSHKNSQDYKLPDNRPQTAIREKSLSIETTCTCDMEQFLQSLKTTRSTNQSLDNYQQILQQKQQLWEQQQLIQHQQHLLNQYQRIDTNNMDYISECTDCSSWLDPRHGLHPMGQMQLEESSRTQTMLSYPQASNYQQQYPSYSIGQINNNNNRNIYNQYQLENRMKMVTPSFYQNTMTKYGIERFDSNFTPPPISLKCFPILQQQQQQQHLLPEMSQIDTHTYGNPSSSCIYTDQPSSGYNFPQSVYKQFNNTYTESSTI